MITAAPLLDLPQAPVPTGGAAEWFIGQGGARLRAALFTSKDPAKVRGSVVLSPGRTEVIEKYFEVVTDLQARGFVVLVHDWRGQGLSHRMLPDRLKGHAEGTQPFLDDYQALLLAFETRLPKPWIAMGHSMGGCLTALALGHGESRFDGAILSAPMFGLNTGGRPKAVTRLLAQAMVLMGKGGDYVLGDPGKPFVSDFANNALTHDQRRFDRAFAQIAACADLALGSPTWSWLKFAFQACDWLAKDAAVTKISIPVIVLGAGAEALVDNAEQVAVTARMPRGRHQMVDGAFHEILMETGALRDTFWQAFDVLAAEVAP